MAFKLDAGKMPDRGLSRVIIGVSVRDIYKVKKVDSSCFEE